MNYIETTIIVDSKIIDTEIIIAELADIGYESFLTDVNLIKAYIQESDFEERKLYEVIEKYSLTNISHFIIGRENWNQQWEASYEPVIIDDFCYIKAPFHISLPNFENELIIEPKMSFGTGHHQTTVLMIKAMRTIDFCNKAVLDMGCGTGILAILAKKLGAKSVLAIDIDNWAIENTLENTVLNNVSDITANVGDINDIAGSFDIILANINRNILLRDIEKYTQSLNTNGIILLSGFLNSDNQIIEEEANKHGLKVTLILNDGEWLSLKFEF